MSLSQNQTAVAKLLLLEGYPEQSPADLAGLVPALDAVLAHFDGVVPQALSCVYNHDAPHGIVQFGHENVPQIVLDGLAVNSHTSMHYNVDLPGVGTSSYAIIFKGVSDELGAWATVNIADSVSSGVDGGLLFCNNPVVMAEYLTPELVVPQAYVEPKLAQQA